MTHSIASFLSAHRVFLESLPGRVWEASWQATLIAVIVLGVQWMLKNRISAQWRNALWALVFARLLLPALPHASFSAYGWIPSHAKPTPAAMSVSAAPVEVAQGGVGENQSAASVSVQQKAETDHPSQAATASVAAPVARASTSGVHWSLPSTFPWVVFVWIAGVLVMVAWDIAGYVRLLHLIKHTQEKPSEGSLKQFADARALLGVRNAELVVSPAIHTPFATGFLRAMVVMPVGMEEKLSEADMKMVLLHELAHVKRGDLWMAWLAWVAATIHWFNPAVRFAMARARKDRELACDEWALRFVPRAKDYGSALIRFLEFSNEAAPGMALGIAGVFESKAALIERIERIAIYRRPSLVRSLLGGAVMAALGLCMLTGAEGKPAKQTPTPPAAAAAATESFTAPAQERLFTAIAAGDLDGVRKAVQDGADVKKQSQFVHAGGYIDRATPIYFAAEQGKLEIAKFLVERGASLAPGDSSWTNPIDAAMRGGFVKVAQYLHAQGATTDPLVYAAATGDLDAVKKLKPSAKAESIAEATKAAAGCGQTAVLDVLLKNDSKLDDAFKRAAATGSTVSLDYFVKRGIDLKKTGIFALSKAASYNQVDAVALLLKQGVNPNDAVPDGKSPLHEAAEAGAVESVKLLLDAKADPNALSHDEFDEGSTPLFSACTADNTEIATLLLDHGARLDIANKGGFTPVLYAAYTHAPHCLALLIDRGADINVHNPQWKSGIRELAAVFNGEQAKRPDMWNSAAQIAKCTETVKVLLDKGVDVNSTDPNGDGNTFLSIAVVNGQTACMEMLLKRGANTNVVNKSGMTLLTSLLLGQLNEKWRFMVLDQLLAHGADPNVGIDNPVTDKEAIPSVLKLAIINPTMSIDDRHKVVKILLDHGARFPVKKGSDEEKMLVAAASGDLEAVKALLARGVSPSVADEKGWTPLLSATALNEEAIFKTLMAAGADAKARDVMGLSPLHFAVYKYPDLTNLRLLLDKGADVNAISTFIYSTPVLQDAIGVKDPTFVRELLQRGAKANLPPGADEHLFQPIELAVENLMMDFKNEKCREIVKMLIAAGANTNPKRRSLLYFPVSNDMVEMTQFLLDAGVDPRKDADGGKELQEETRKHGSKEMKELVAKALEKAP